MTPHAQTALLTTVKASQFTPYLLLCLFPVLLHLSLVTLCLPSSELPMVLPSLPLVQVGRDGG